MAVEEVDIGISVNSIVLGATGTALLKINVPTSPK